MRVTIGCPVRSREWILPRWFTHVSLAADTAGVDLEFVFVGARDDPSHEAIAQHCPGTWKYVDSQEQVQPERAHLWNPTEYRHMTNMRNFLLHAARQTEPDYFLSLDSDILLHEDALANLIETAESGWDAVGGKCWMTEIMDACSYLVVFNAHSYVRPDVSAVIPADVIMAIKLMGPKALAQDYVFDVWGEDVGWSRAAQEAGLKLAFDGRVCSRHVMSQRDRDGRLWSETVDPRCGF